MVHRLFSKDYLSRVIVSATLTSSSFTAFPLAVHADTTTPGGDTSLTASISANNTSVNNQTNLQQQTVANVSVSSDLSTVDAGQTTNISGTVYDTNGKIVANAPITLTASGGNLAQTSVITDSTGNFATTFTAPASAGSVHVTAGVSGGSVTGSTDITVTDATQAASSNSNPSPAGSVQPTDTTIPSTAPTVAPPLEESAPTSGQTVATNSSNEAITPASVPLGVLTGTLYAADGLTMVPNANITIESDSDQHLYNTVSDDSGSFQFDVPQGSYHVVDVGVHSLAAPVPVTVSSGTNAQNITDADLVEFTGTLKGADGVPIASATIDMNDIPFDISKDTNWQLQSMSVWTNTATYSPIPRQVRCLTGRCR